VVEWVAPLEMPLSFALEVVSRLGHHVVRGAAVRLLWRRCGDPAMMGRTQSRASSKLERKPKATQAASSFGMGLDRAMLDTWTTRSVGDGGGEGQG
jgi:hypothetical protein